MSTNENDLDPRLAEQDDEASERNSDKTRIPPKPLATFTADPDGEVVPDPSDPERSDPPPKVGNPPTA